MEYSLEAEPTHSVWDRSLEPRLRIHPGDEVQIECVDSSGSQVCQVVNEPVHTVSASIPKEILPEKRLFSAQ